MHLEDFVSLRWWVSIGIGSLLLSLCSDLFRRGFYKLLGHASAKWRTRSERSRAAFEAEVGRAAASRVYLSALEKREVRLMLRAIFMMVTALGLFAVLGLILLAYLVFPHEGGPHFLRPVCLGGIGLGWLVSTVASTEFLRTLRHRAIIYTAMKRCAAQAAALTD